MNSEPSTYEVGHFNIQQLGMAPGVSLVFSAKITRGARAIFLSPHRDSRTAILKFAERSLDCPGQSSKLTYLLFEVFDFRRLSCVRRGLSS